jgi:hypothetical protein
MVRCLRSYMLEPQQQLQLQHAVKPNQLPLLLPCCLAALDFRHWHALLLL